MLLGDLIKSVTYRAVNIGRKSIDSERLPRARFCRAAGLKAAPEFSPVQRDVRAAGRFRFVDRDKPWLSINRDVERPFKTRQGLPGAFSGTHLHTWPSPQPVSTSGEHHLTPFIF